MKLIKWSLSENALIINQTLLTTSNSFNLLNPNIKIQILICCPYLFSMEVVERICWAIRFILCDQVLNSHDHCVL